MPGFDSAHPAHAHGKDALHLKFSTFLLCTAYFSWFMALLNDSAVDLDQPPNLSGRVKIFASGRTLVVLHTTIALVSQQVGKRSVAMTFLEGQDPYLHSVSLRCSPAAVDQGREQRGQLLVP